MTGMPKYEAVFHVMGRTSTPLEYATELARTLWEKHYKADSPNWEPLNDLVGILTQIDNMTAGLTREKPSKMVCGACGEEWRDGLECGQKLNGHATPTCYPAFL